jgi:hypothetical protein
MWALTGKADRAGRTYRSGRRVADETHSGVMLAALATWPHFAMSEAMN